MEVFLSRQKIKPSSVTAESQSRVPTLGEAVEDEDDSTDLKLATLASLFPGMDQATLLDLLISAEGSVDVAKASLSSPIERISPRKRSAAAVGYQTSLSAFHKDGREDAGSPLAKRRVLTKKGQTLHLYTPEDIAAHTPCSIIHNFLPPQQADSLLQELLEEALTFQRQTFKLFDNVVQSPHSACFYVDNLEEQRRQKTEFLYNGSYLEVYAPSSALYRPRWFTQLLIPASIGCSPDHTSNA